MIVSRSVAVAVPAVLLAAVAAVQMGLATFGSLSPWKGGGFGMFASLDGLGFREVRLHVETGGRAEAIALPPSLVDPAQRAAVFPTDAALDALGRGVLARELRHGRTPTVARVEVWRTRFSQVLDATEERLAVRAVSADARMAREGG